MSKENKFEKELRRREKLSAYFYDLSKMSLTASVVSLIPVIISEGHQIREIEIYTVVIGVILGIYLSYVANKLLNY